MITHSLSFAKEDGWFCFYARHPSFRLHHICCLSVVKIDSLRTHRCNSFKRMEHHDICLLHCERKEGKKVRNKEALKKDAMDDAMDDALKTGSGKESEKHDQQENGQ